MPKILYLDANATTPLDAAVLKVMLPHLKGMSANPSSAHGPGRQARHALDQSRSRLASLLGAAPDEIVFTGSGSEASTLALLGAVRAANRPVHVITASTEHPAVLGAVEKLVTEGHRSTVLDVDAEGRVRVADFERALAADTFLASIMLANNETGVLQPVATLARLAHERGVLFHTDAVQALGKVPVDVKTLGVDMLNLAAHKFYGPKGVGALFVRGGVKLERVITGGHQEKDRRPGTENVPGIVGLAHAAALAVEAMPEDGPRLGGLRERLWEQIITAVPTAVRNTPVADSLPNTLHVSFPGLASDALVMSLDLEGVCASGGAACHSGAHEPSHVLKAMKMPRDRALGSVRLSLSRHLTEKDIDRAGRLVVGAVRQVQEAQ